MTITYSCIANGRAVLAELALTGGSYKESAAAVLRQVLLTGEPESVTQMGSFVYHTLSVDGITYLCATDKALDTLKPSSFLKNVKYNNNEDDSSIFTLKTQEYDVKSGGKVLQSEKRLNINTNQADDTEAMMPRSGIARSCRSSILNFLRNINLFSKKSEADNSLTNSQRIPENKDS
ncbi:vesicle-associated membrane protein 7-like [Sorex fumeus]|uniref:vesicle-associated membrane protein 7-like n=1 Tax=Sorex fumeus TaxID=62283 RepID=UPI0024AE4473|nr:vesicle-associated membrane protein 7-like [Sorex fumeus]